MPCRVHVTTIRCRITATTVFYACERLAFILQRNQCPPTKTRTSAGGRTARRVGINEHRRRRFDCPRRFDCYFDIETLRAYGVVRWTRVGFEIRTRDRGTIPFRSVSTTVDGV